jgi:hypothetical protein
MTDMIGPPVEKVTAWEHWSRWARENLFSSVFNSILTFVTVGILYLFIRGAINFAFDPERMWFTSLAMLIRFLMLALAGFALLAPTFGGTEQSRTVLVGVWVVVDLVIAYLIAVSMGMTGIPVLGDYIGGLNLTFLLAIAGISLSFPLGVMLAVADGVGDVVTVGVRVEVKLAVGVGVRVGVIVMDAVAVDV